MSTELTSPLTDYQLAAAYAEFYREMWMRTAQAYGPTERHTVAAFETYEAARQEAELEETWEIADIIEQQVFESKPVGYWWTISAVARKGNISHVKARRVLEWMVRHQYAISNGRGGCWVNYGRRH